MTKRKTKGKINEDGVLEVERAGKFKKMECMKSMTGEMPGVFDCNFCSDDCSLFDEPEPQFQYDYDTELSTPTGRTYLNLCEKAWIFDEFEDER